MAFVRRETSEEEEEEEADGAVAGSATGKKRASPFLYCCKSYERGTKKGRKGEFQFVLAPALLLLSLVLSVEIVAR